MSSSLGRAQPLIRTISASSGVPHHRHHPLRAFVRAASWHRRKLAVLAAVATVLTGLAALAPPDPPTTTVVRTREALAGGVVLAPDDLESVALPRSALPDDAAQDVDTLVGLRLAGPATRHQVLTSAALASGDLAVGVGHVLAPVRLADADVVALLHPGDLVDVIAAAPDSGATTTVTRRARVVTVPARGADDLGSAAGALVVLDLPAADAEGLAKAAAISNLTVTWS